MQIIVRNRSPAGSDRAADDRLFEVVCDRFDHKSISLQSRKSPYGALTPFTSARSTSDMRSLRSAPANSRCSTTFSNVLSSAICGGSTPACRRAVLS